MLRRLAIASTCLVALGLALRDSTPAPYVPAHGSVIAPASRVYRVYKSNPERPAFPLAARAVQLDGSTLR